jgi:hypothetical protein
VMRTEIEKCSTYSEVEAAVYSVRRRMRSNGTLRAPEVRRRVLWCRRVRVCCYRVSEGCSEEVLRVVARTRRGRRARTTWCIYSVPALCICVTEMYDTLKKRTVLTACPTKHLCV